MLLAMAQLQAETTTNSAPALAGETITRPSPAMLSAADAQSFLKVPGITDEQIKAVLASGSGISGPGKLVIGKGWGGFFDGRREDGTSGHTAVTDQNRAKTASGASVTEHLIPSIRPIWDIHMRDTVICRGGDGFYYMTGSTGENIWMYNDGVEIYRSADLQKWEYLGLVWSIEKDGVAWEKTWRNDHKRARPIRAIWAPELHYIHKNYYLCISMPDAGIAILKSATGKPEGPYVHAAGAQKALVNSIDPTLFEDDDGAVYFTCHGADTIARMKDDLSDFAEPPRPVTLLHTDHDPARHSKVFCKRTNYQDLGFEGATLFKANGIYFLGVTDLVDGHYTMCLATSKSIHGPYEGRQCPVPGNGGTGFFQDKAGHWFTSYFGDDTMAPWRSKPGILRVDISADGKVTIAKDQPDFILAPSSAE